MDVPIFVLAMRNCALSHGNDVKRHAGNSEKLNAARLPYENVILSVVMLWSRYQLGRYAVAIKECAESAWCGIDFNVIMSVRCKWFSNMLCLTIYLDCIHSVYCM